MGESLKHLFMAARAAQRFGYGAYQKMPPQVFLGHCKNYRKYLERAVTSQEALKLPDFSGAAGELFDDANPSAFKGISLSNNYSETLDKVRSCLESNSKLILRKVRDLESQFDVYERQHVRERLREDMAKTSFAVHRKKVFELASEVQMSTAEISTPVWASGSHTPVW